MNPSLFASQSARKDTNLSALTWIFVSIVSVATGQGNTVGTINYNPQSFSSGYTLIYPHNQPHARLINACGEIVHIWENDLGRLPGNSAMLSPNGELIWAHRPEDDSDSPIIAGGRGETIEMVTWTNEPMWSFTLNDSTGRLHHDFALMNNGNVLAIAWERIDSLSAIQAGRNPENLEGGELWSERLIQLAPNANGGANVVWEWRAWDHLIQNFDSTKANFGVIADHPNRIDVNYGIIGNIQEDWLHANSVDFNPLTNQILLSVPNFGELWIIDRNQMESGIVWRWGNPEAYGLGADNDQQLFYQHSGVWLDAPYLQNSPDFGKIGVFNNRNPGATGPYSSVHLIEPTWQQEDSSYAMEEDVFLPNTFDWTWTAPVPTDFFSSGLSNFERLANGNNLILAGRQGEIIELTASGDTAWHYRVPLQGGSAIAQGTALGTNDNILFKARRYPAQFPAFNDVNLEAMGFWELNPQPLFGCLPCDISLSLEVNEGAFAAVSTTGAIGEVTVVWSLDDVALCAGDTLQFSDPDSFCAANLALLVPGDIITVTAYDEQGCETSSTFVWTLETGITENAPRLGVFPNPNQGNFALVGAIPHSHITIRNSTGQTVWKSNAFDEAELRISLEHLPSGWYFVETDGAHMPIIITPH